MKEKVITCDVCGKKINPWFDSSFYKCRVKNYWLFADGTYKKYRSLDICNDCWTKIRDSIRKEEFY